MLARQGKQQDTTASSVSPTTVVLRHFVTDMSSVHYYRIRTAYSEFDPPTYGSGGRVDHVEFVRRYEVDGRIARVTVDQDQFEVVVN